MSLGAWIPLSIVVCGAILIIVEGSNIINAGVIKAIVGIGCAIMIVLNLIVVGFLMVSDRIPCGELAMFDIISGCKLKEKGYFDTVTVSKKDNISFNQYISGLTSYSKILKIKIKHNTSEMQSSNVEYIDKEKDDEIGLRVNSGSKYDVFVRVNGIYYNVGDVKHPSGGVKYKIVYANDSYEKNGNIESYNRCKIIRLEE